MFDLLTALLDSWSLWNRAAGRADDGMRWRRAYLALTYGCGAYRPYEDLVREAALETGVAAKAAENLVTSWDSLQPWPEAPGLLRGLRDRAIPI
ncbi:hypothetical protein, partial [Sphingomonas sp. 66-10]